MGYPYLLCPVPRLGWAHRAGQDKCPLNHAYLGSSSLCCWPLPHTSSSPPGLLLGFQSPDSPSWAPICTSLAAGAQDKCPARELSSSELEGSRSNWGAHNPLLRPAADPLCFMGVHAGVYTHIYTHRQACMCTHVEVHVCYIHAFM